MKKKIISLLIAGMALGGAVTYGAVSNYYTDILKVQQPSMEKELEEHYNELNSEIGRQVHADTILYVDIKRNELLQGAHDYLDETMGGEAQRRLNSHRQAIDEMAEQIEQELRQFVDELVAE